jgi:site-specific DNA recombinase
MRTKATAKAEPAPVPRRCAIYTRKSTTAGLEQEFSSLDAQREAGEAYIQAQKHAGWQCLSEHYDDGGFSGASIERPALQRLLVDLEAGRIDVVVVYKVDRLSRSLLDFARLMERFEKHNVAFVSVTQQFNTAQSMGRLVLNVLLSFAQFEREMISERTRDKMAAARRKGKWVGGQPPFGYDVATAGRKLVINPDEAAQVQAIFDLYLQEQSLLRVVETINSRGWRTKEWRNKKGELHEGGPWGKGTVSRVLTSVTYLGKVDYKGEIFEGEHEAIVDAEVFARVGELLRNGKREPARRRNDHGFLLRGLIRCTKCGSIMSSTTARPRGTVYRYYLCGEVNRRGLSSCSVRRVSAAELERFVVARLRDMGADPKLLQDTIEAVVADRQRDKPQLEKELRSLRASYEAGRGEARKLVAALAEQTEGGDNRSITDRLAELDLRAAQIEVRIAEIQRTLVAMTSRPVDRTDVAHALSLFNPVWDGLKPREQARVLHLLIDHIDYDGDSSEVAITFHAAGIESLAREVAAAAKPPPDGAASAAGRAS